MRSHSFGPECHLLAQKIITLDPNCIEVGFELSTDDRRLEGQHTDDGPAGNAIRIQSDDFSEQEDGTQDHESGSS